MKPTEFWESSLWLPDLPPPHDETEDTFGLHCGAHMTQKEFHRLYEQMPENYRAELIGGMVYEPSPLGWDHGRSHAYLTAAFLAYTERTPGLEVGENGTVILSNEDEVQPDVVLRISPECSGQSRNTKPRPTSGGEPGVRYVKGAP